MKKNLTPNFLTPGDTVTIIATARKVNNTEIDPAIEFLKQQGFKVILSKNLFKECNQFSGTDKQRARDLQLALDKPKIKAVFIARGGYGTARIF